MDVHYFPLRPLLRARLQWFHLHYTAGRTAVASCFLFRELCAKGKQPAAEVKFGKATNEFTRQYITVWFTTIFSSGTRNIHVWRQSP